MLSISNSVGKNFNTENKFNDQVNDIEYFSFIKRLIKFFKGQSNSELSIKLKKGNSFLKDFKDKNISYVNHKKKLDEIVDNYDYFIISHFSTPVKELIMKNKKIIILLKNSNNQLFLSESYKMLKKNCLLAKNEYEFFKILKDISSGKVKKQFKVKEQLKFINMYL